MSIVSEALRACLYALVFGALLPIAAHARPEAVKLVSIAISPHADRLPPGGVAQLTVVGTYANGTHRPLPAWGETFHSSNPRVATVSASGILTVAADARALATVTIGATNKVAHVRTSPAESLTLTVETALVSVAVAPLAVSQVPGGTWQLAVTGTYNSGQVVTLDPSGEAFTTSDRKVATVGADGILTVAAGAAARATATISVKDKASGVSSTPATSALLTVAKTGKPPTARSASAVESTVNGNPLCTSIEPFYWEIGDQSGAMLAGSAGTGPGGTPVLATTAFPVASASKWLYAAYVAQWRGAAGNVTASDIAFLHFTSGYTNMGDSASACSSVNTAAECLQVVNAAGVPFGTQDPATIGLFDYDGGHMENHAVLAATPLANQSFLALGTTVAAALGPSLTLSYSQPLMPGGVTIDSDNYGLFLRGMLAGTVLLRDLLGTSPVCTSLVDCPTTVAFSPIPEAWHYSLGHWVEDDPSTNGDGAFSSPGSYGYYPWIDHGKRYYGLIARSNTTGGSEQEGYISAQCGRLLRAAWATGVVQTGTIPSRAAARQ